MRTLRKTSIALAVLVLSGWVHGPSRADEGVAVIGHASLRGLDAGTLTRIYTGRTIEVDGVAVTAVNALAGSTVRNRFLQQVLRQDEEKYTAYWTVRRYIGKGASPRELGGTHDIVAFVNGTPGGIGYIDLADVRPGMNVLFRFPP